jgi:hypothetical protein
MTQDIPAFLQTSNGELSLPALCVLILSAMVASIFATIAVYVLIVRRFNAHFEAKERVSGIHSSFLEAVDAERNSQYSESSSKSSSLSSSFDSSNLAALEQQIEEQAEKEDFEEAVIREINSKKITQTQQLSNKRERGSYASSAREVSV